MKVVVADASAIVEYLLRTRRASGIEGVITATDSDLHVPALCDIEICSALRRALLRNRISEERATEALKDYLDLPLSRHGHVALVEKVLQLRRNFSAYDATYVALAEYLKAIFVTEDGSLARTVRQFFPKWDVRI
ncbi:MAG TPA: type II toxin-antitoxin system VapC family toxin [Acidobacteriota bacterium]|nr:type II toxin-antitoxin system VapC family toxin [Acidobacteriota bacterium]